MKIRVLAFAIIIAIALTGTAFSVPPGKTMVFPDGKIGPVTFDGKVHKLAGAKCKDCHNGEVFPKMKDAKKVPGPPKIKMKDIYAGKSCGACHNGEKQINGKTVFKAKKNCKKCHIKKK